jgi:hypothetical protein
LESRRLFRSLGSRGDECSPEVNLGDLWYSAK